MALGIGLGWPFLPASDAFFAQCLFLGTARIKTATSFDARRCEYVDLVEAGIIDPTKAMRTAIENAVSVASTLLLAEATLTEVEDEKAKEPLPPEMM